MEEKLKKLEEFLTPKSDYFYNPGDFITAEEIDVILKFPQAMRKNLMPGIPNGVSRTSKNFYRYSAELRCRKCGEKVLFENITKNQLLEKISSKRWGCVCDICKQKEIDERSRQRSAYEAERLRQLPMFLSPNNSFCPEVKPWKRYSLLRNILPFFEQDFTQYAEDLKALSYHDFLKTPYWDAISQKVRQQYHYMCSLCGRKEGLNVHHKTYIHHGYEAYHLEDLICLCAKCHSKFHGKEIA